MKTIIHKASDRGHANHGWLDSWHSFSFARYHNPERMRFGVLRVLNDDTVAPGMGFGEHPHDNMEIISIPLEGDLEHKDSMGNSEVINEGDIQVMSAGSGVFHSEYNKNSDREVKFLQIWLFPRKKNVKPRYAQIAISDKEQKNRLVQVVSPDRDDEGLWIHQDAWLHMGSFSPGKEDTYQIRREGNGVYLFVIEGAVEVDDQQLRQRDGIGISDTDTFSFRAHKDARILIMDIPMNLSNS